MRSLLLLLLLQLHAFLLLLLLLLQLSLKFQDVLFFLSQQAAELLVTLSEVSLTRYQGLVALTQLCVQLNTNINRRRSHIWDKRLNKRGD